MARTWILNSLAFMVITCGPVPAIRAICGYLFGKQNRGVIHNLLISLVLWCVMQVFVALVAGSLHTLCFWAVVLSECTLMVIGAVCLYCADKNRDNSWHICASRNPAPGNDELLLALIPCALFFIAFVRGLAEPIVNYDSLAYHLPTMVQWYQASSFVPWHNELWSRYPFNWELLCVLFFFPFNNDLLVTFPNYIAIVILYLSIYGISVLHGATRKNALLCSAMALIIPEVVVSTNTLHVDMPFAAFFMSSLFLILFYGKTRDIAYLFIFFLSFGLLMGIKTSAFVYGAVLILVLLYLVFQSKTNAEHPDRILTVGTKALLVCFLFIAFFIGGFWYVKNLIEVGNPLGHLKVNMFGYLLFDGTFDPDILLHTTLFRRFSVFNISNWKVLFGEISQRLGMPFYVLLSITLACLPLYVFKKNLFQPINKKIFMFVVLSLAVICLYWITPFTADSFKSSTPITPWIGNGFRYAIPLFALLGIAASLFLALIPEIVSAGFGVLLIGTSAIQIANTNYVNDYSILGVDYSILFFIYLFGMYMLYVLVKFLLNSRYLRKPLFKITVVTLFLLPFLVLLNMFNGERQSARHKNCWYSNTSRYIDTHLPKGKKIGYMYFNRPYPLTGYQWNAAVEYIAPTDLKSREALVSLMKQRNMHYLAVGWDFWDTQTPVILDWLNEPGGPFDRVCGNKPGKKPQYEIVLYELK